MDWYAGSIPDAVAEVKSHKKVLLVFVMGEDELSKKTAVIYDDPEVSNKLNSKECVALKLTVNSVPYHQFSQIYPVVVIPSSYFIGKNGLPIEIITGSLEPGEFMAKIDRIFQLNEEGDIPANADSSQSSELTLQNPEPMEASESDTSDVVHNGCGSSNQPSTSQPETASASAIDAENSSQEAKNTGGDVSLEERVNRAKTLLENRRQNKAAEEQEDWVSPRKNCISSLPVTESGRKRLKLEETENKPKEKREEQERRKVGRAVQQAQQERQENELKAWAESRAKEKEEERLARERVRAQIAQDRAERAAKYQQTKADDTIIQKEKEMQRIKEEQERATRDASLRSTIARLQFRLPDGTSVTHQFAANSTLEEARKFVIEEIRPSFPNFTLCTTFPRRHFVEEDYLQSLKDLQLAPSAAILILPGTAVTVANQPGGFFGNLFWMVVSPFLAVWRAISSYFRKDTRQGDAANEPPEPQPGPSGTQAPSVAAAAASSSNQSPKNDVNEKDGPVVRKRNPQKFYQEGNVFRINNRQTDDDDNSTYNGNSTQQM